MRHVELEVIGLLTPQTCLEMEAHAEGPDEKSCLRMLARIKMEAKANRVRLFNAPHSTNQHCQTQFSLLGPRERAVRVRGVYSAISVADLTNGADIETTQARITIENVRPFVKARVDQGIIDYSVHHGSATLFAGWNLNLKFEAQELMGNLEATSEGAVRVLIPRGFTSCFEADVARTAEFVCRAEIASQIVEHRKGKRTIYKFGEGKPAIRLKSLKGPVVIDNFETIEGT